jgi:4-hydroxybenzoate polyprenyltransferase
MGNGEWGMGNQEKPKAATAPPPAHSPLPTPHSPFQRIRLFLELIRFSHTIFALPFALLAAAMAWSVRHAWWKVNVAATEALERMAKATPRLETESSSPLADQILNLGPSTPIDPGYWFRWQELLGIVLCMVFARSAAMAFNRVVDWRFDAENPRTAKRHIPAGLLNRNTVILFTAICAAGFVASTLLFLPNRWPLYLSLPVLAFLCGYSLTKRFTSLAHFWLGAALALAPLAAWIALLGPYTFDWPWPPLLLGGVVLLWVAGFDIIYATQDVEVDRKLKLRSVPARFGVPGALRIAALCHLGMLGLLFALPSVFPQFGLTWYLGVGAVALLLAYEHAIVRPDDLTRVNTAFFNCNAVVSLGLLAVGVIDLLV